MIFTINKKPDIITMIDRKVLEHLRRIIIELLCVLDEALGLPRTVPSKEQRRKLQQSNRG